MSHYRIPNDLLREYGGAMGPYGIAVYNALALHANGEGECWPRQQVIAQMTGMSARKVRETVQALVALDLVYVAQRGNGRSNVYRLKKIAAHGAGQDCKVEPTPAPRAGQVASRVVLPLTMAAPRAGQNGSIAAHGAGQTKIAAPCAGQDRNDMPPIAAPRAGPIKEQNPINKTQAEPVGHAYGEVEAFRAMVAELAAAQTRNGPDHAGLLSFEGAYEDHETLVFQVGIADHRARDWIVQRYSKTMQRSLASMMNQPVALEFVVMEEVAA